MSRKIAFGLVIFTAVVALSGLMSCNLASSILSSNSATFDSVNAEMMGGLSFAYSNNGTFMINKTGAAGGTVTITGTIPISNKTSCSFSIDLKFTNFYYSSSSGGLNGESGIWGTLSTNATLVTINAQEATSNNFTWDTIPVQLVVNQLVSTNNKSTGMSSTSFSGTFDGVSFSESTNTEILDE